MSNKLRISCLASAVLLSTSAFSAVPQGYPADYQKIIDAATKEGKVVLYSTTDTKTAARFPALIRQVFNNYISTDQK